MSKRDRIIKRALEQLSADIKDFPEDEAFTVEEVEEVLEEFED